jgi:hypothetical protein
MYSLLWGQDIARGELPRFGGVPTPHPLSNVVATFLAPAGADAEGALLAISYLSAGALAWNTWLVGSRLFGPVAGVVGASLLLTRDVVTFHTALAYLDLPWAALVMAAVAVEVRTPGRGELTLPILALAGLLRPEAWFISALYWLWIVRGGVDGRRAVTLAAIGVSGPALWFLADLVVTGDPLFSFTGTRDAAATVAGKESGLGALLTSGPRILGQPLRPAVAVCAIAGLAAGLALRRPQTLFAVGWALGLTLAFAVPVAAGTILSARYAIPTVAMVCVFAGAAIGLGVGHGRPVGYLVASACAVLLLVTLPSHIGRLEGFRHQVRSVDQSRSDVEQLVSGRMPCAPIVVPNGRLVPLVAVWRRMKADDVVRSDRMPTSRGTFVSGTPRALRGLVVLPTRDRGRRLAAMPRTARSWRQLGGWALWASC